MRRPRTQDTTDHAAYQLLAMRSRCPSNDELAAAIGARGAAAGAAALRRLEQKGMVRVEREHGWRRVTLTEFRTYSEGEDA
ncbi:hypothetical protein [Novosphingobium sp. 9]|uniref:hypothetical protein n=1 Tax=Novosphingobium sp. 9 TaxID=2025349 RepID=UPI0021B59E1F|nr:hypothetical protein [Novosphingobium sp. 9]